MAKRLNYNTDLIKHYVRYYGWVKPFKNIVNHVDAEIKRKNRTIKCKYLTFCAVQAIDVFLFEYMKYVYRNKETNRLENVYFCENDKESFAIIQNLIGSAEQGFFGDFKEIMLQNELVDSLNPNDPFDEPDNYGDRQTLRLIQVKKEIKSKFPFDVINLDFYGNFFPNSESRYSDSLQTYKEVLELQKRIIDYNCKRFLMYLTVYTPMFNEIRFINPDVVTIFEKVLYENLVYKEFNDAFNIKFGHNNPKEIEIYIKFILGFAKQVIFKETYSIGWNPHIINILTYDRVHSDGTPHKETTFVVDFYRCSELENFKDFNGTIYKELEEEYKNQLLDLVTNKPEFVPKPDEISEEVSNNLREIIKYRNNFLKQIGIYDTRFFE